MSEFSAVNLAIDAVSLPTHSVLILLSTFHICIPHTQSYLCSGSICGAISFSLHPLARLSPSPGIFQSFRLATSLSTPSVTPMHSQSTYSSGMFALSCIKLYFSDMHPHQCPLWAPGWVAFLVSWPWSKVRSLLIRCKKKNVLGVDCFSFSLSRIAFTLGWGLLLTSFMLPL